MNKDYIVCMVTAGSEEEALKIGKTIVEEGLCACCNVIKGVKSIFMWKGKLCEEAETLCIFKTRRDLFDRFKKRVKEIHSYEVPEIIALNIEDGLSEYLDWIGEVTRQ